MKTIQVFFPDLKPKPASDPNRFFAAVLPILAILITACAQNSLPAPSVTHERGRAVEAEDEFGPYYAYIPTNLAEKADVLVLIHGTPPKNQTALSNARFYIQNWIDFSEKHGMILIAPAFNQEDFSSVLGDHALGGYRGLFGRKINADEWVLRLVKAYQQEYSPADGKFYLYGHSAGGQFVGRFLVVHPELIKRAVITSAATYPQPDPQAAWPFGMGELHADIVWDAETSRRVDIAPAKQKWLAATQIPLTVIVGLNDTAELPASLIPAQKGVNRTAIARNWVQDMTAFARANGLENRFRLEIIPGQGHTMSGLLPYSMAALVLDE